MYRFAVTGAVPSSAGKEVCSPEESLELVFSVLGAAGPCSAIPGLIIRLLSKMEVLFWVYN